jgi:hypothetical protein
VNPSQVLPYSRLITGDQAHNREGRNQMALTDKTHSVLRTGLANKASADEIKTILNGGGTVTATPETSQGVGAVAGTGSTVVEYGNDIVHKTVITLAALSVTMTDAGAAGSHGSTKIYDFPAGNILIHGSTTNLTTLAGSGGITDTAALVGAVGSVATVNDNATLTTTEANICPSAAGTLTDGAGVLKGKSTDTSTIDGTATAVDALLNLAVPDAGSSANDTVAVTGTVTILWSNLGDN